MDAQRRTFHRCRAPTPHGLTFTIDECSFGQVMNLETAEVGYSDPAYLIPVPPYTQPHCPSRNCTLSVNNTVFPQCNGRRDCTISQDLLIRPGPGDTALCVLQTDANFINIKFYCVGTTYFSYIWHHYLFTYDCIFLLL